MTGAYARVAIWLRWPLALAVIAGVTVAAIKLPSFDSVDHGALGNLVPPHSQAIKAEREASERLGVPIISRTLLVQRDPAGLSTSEQFGTLTRAIAAAGASTDILGAIPYVNRPEVAPASRERNTTAVTGLFFRPGLDPLQQPAKAREFVDRAHPPHVAGVTGSIPAQVAQGDLVQDRLPLVEGATALLVALMVGLYFRSLVAPLLTVGTVAMAYLLTDRLLAQLAQHADVSVPQEVHPVIVVLLFGVVTDYSIFFLSRARDLLRAGHTRLEAATEATAGISGIVTAAAVTVAGASMALYASNLDFLRGFGPGMAGSVLVAWLVVILFVPAMLGILGRLVFWPTACAPDPAVAAVAADADAGADPRPQGSPLVRFSVRHPLVMSILCLILLGFAVSGVGHLRLGNPVISSLPSDDQVRQGYDALASGVGPGAAAPTVVLVRSPGADRQPARVRAFQRWLDAQPGVADVVGPGDLPVAQAGRVALDRDGARFLVLFDHDPLGGRAVADFQDLKHRAGGALRATGLHDSSVAFAGDTAVTAEMVHSTTINLIRIGAAVLVLLFLILAAYLRAVVAPLYLLASSVLALLAAVGLSTYVFQDLLGHDGLSYFTVITAGVLLVALGSDYNVFLVGDIWREAKQRPAREAIIIAASRTSKPITVAGLVLALSFALLVLVPVTLFAEIAVVMFLGLLVDTFVVRTLLAPALISLFGSAGSWPGGRLRRRRDRTQLAAAADGPPADGG